MQPIAKDNQSFENPYSYAIFFFMLALLERYHGYDRLGIFTFILSGFFVVCAKDIKPYLVKYLNETTYLLPDHCDGELAYDFDHSLALIVHSLEVLNHAKLFGLQEVTTNNDYLKPSTTFDRSGLENYASSTTSFWVRSSKLNRPIEIRRINEQQVVTEISSQGEIQTIVPTYTVVRRG